MWDLFRRSRVVVLLALAGFLLALAGFSLQTAIIGIVWWIAWLAGIAPPINPWLLFAMAIAGGIALAAYSFRSRNVRSSTPAA